MKAGKCIIEEYFILIVIYFCNLTFTFTFCVFIKLKNSLKFWGRNSTLVNKSGINYGFFYLQCLKL